MLLLYIQQLFNQLCSINDIIFVSFKFGIYRTIHQNCASQNKSPNDDVIIVQKIKIF